MEKAGKFLEVSKAHGVQRAILLAAAKVVGVDIHVEGLHPEFHAGMARSTSEDQQGDEVSGLPRKEDSLATHPSYSRWNKVLPLPNPRLMLSIGAADVENFYVVADAWAQVISQYLTEGARVLDIGCGCGRTARFFLHHPFLEKYIGFDVIQPSVDWNNRFFKEQAGERFQFHHFDLYSRNYNPDGELQVCDLVFPVEDGEITLVFAASLFTHILEEDAKHYLREMARVLTSGAIAIVSIHTKPEPGEKYSGTEYRIDVEPEYFEALAAETGLQLLERLGELCGQEAYVFKKG